MPSKRRSPRPRAVKEPVQVYLTAADSALLASLASDAGLSKAEILRRGLRSFARDRDATGSPMRRYLDEASAAEWPDTGGASPDDLLADEYLALKHRRE